MRFVSAIVFRTSASCSRVVIPGLSDKKSLPCFMARTPSGARSLAICELSTSCMDGSLRISSCVLTIFTLGNRLREIRELVLFADPGRHQFSAAALNRPDHAVDVVVAHAADGKLDVIFRRLFRLLRTAPRLRLRGYALLPKAIAPCPSPAIIATDPIHPVCLRKSRLPVVLIFIPFRNPNSISNRGTNAQWGKSPWNPCPRELRLGLDARRGSHSEPHSGPSKEPS